MRIVRQYAQILLNLRNRHFESILACFWFKVSPFLLAGNFFERRRGSSNPIVQLYLKSHFLSYFDSLSPINLNWLYLQFKLISVLFILRFNRSVFAVFVLLFLCYESLSVFVIFSFRFMFLLLDTLELFIDHLHPWVILDVSLLLILLWLLHNGDRHKTLIIATFWSISWVIFLFTC